MSGTIRHLFPYSDVKEKGISVEKVSGWPKEINRFSHDQSFSATMHLNILKHMPVTIVIHVFIYFAAVQDLYTFYTICLHLPSCPFCRSVSYVTALHNTHIHSLGDTHSIINVPVRNNEMT